MSTSTFQGRDNERNSSRVLKPPGGGSSDLFGSGSQSAAESANQSRTKQTSSNIFGDPYDPVRDVRRSDQKAAADSEQKKQERGQYETPTYVRAEKPQEDTQSKLFGDHSNQSRRTGKGQGAYNPITGEEYRESQAKEAASNGDGPQQIRNSSKVLAPPGGKSSGIF